MQLIEINQLVPHEKNEYFFDDIQGDNWIEFKKSIHSSGVIEPVIITQNKVIVSGHQRVRACKELKITEIPCEVKIYENDESIVKDLLETNLRQRGIGNTNPIKFARCIVELENIYGIKNGGDRKSDKDNLGLKTQSDLANEFNVSDQQLRDYKKLLTLIPELQDLIENNTLSPTVGYKVLSKLSKEEQQKLINDIGKDYIASLTQKKAEELAKEIKSDEYDDLSKSVKSLEIELKNKKEEFENIEKKLKEKVDSTSEDYNKLNNEYKKKNTEIKKLKDEIDSLTNVSETEKYQQKLKDSTVFFCGRVNDFIEKTGGYTWLTDHINELPEYEKRSFIKAIDIIENWVFAMKANMKNYL